MKESYGEDRASHTAPESWTVARKGGCQALTRACAGGLLSREILPVRGADGVSVQRTMFRTQRRVRMSPDLEWICQAAWQDRQRQCPALFPHVYRLET